MNSSTDQENIMLNNLRYLKPRQRCNQNCLLGKWKLAKKPSSAVIAKSLAETYIFTIFDQNWYANYGRLIITC